MANQISGEDLGIALNEAIEKGTIEQNNEAMVRSLLAHRHANQIPVGPYHDDNNKYVVWRSMESLTYRKLHNDAENPLGSMYDGYGGAIFKAIKKNNVTITRALLAHLNFVQLSVQGKYQLQETVHSVLNGDIEQKVELIALTMKHPRFNEIDLTGLDAVNRGIVESARKLNRNRMLKNILKWTAIVILVVLASFLLVYFIRAVFQMSTNILSIFKLFKVTP